MRYRPLLLPFLLALMLPGASRAQDAPTAWRVTSSPMLDLWSRGAALVTREDGAVLPLYAPAARDAAGEWAALGRAMQPLRGAIASDTAFEVLHFAPLPLAAEDPDAALRALGAPGGGSVAVERTRTALDVALPGAARQRALAGFVRALEQGWRSGGRDAWLRGAPERTARMAELEAAWRAEFLPALAPFLRGIGARGGVILAQPAIGGEGRVLDDGAGGWIVAVGDGPGARPLLAAVRELCFPLVRRTIDADPTSPAAGRGGDQAAAALHERAAVRCGAMLVARRLPGRLRAYEAMYGAASDAQLASRHSLPPAAERALAAAVNRVAGDPATLP